MQVTFVTRVALPASPASFLTISGLQSSASASSTLTLSLGPSSPPHLPSPLPSSALFDAANGTLVLTLANTTRPATAYVFSFVIQNPSAGQLAPALSIAASGALRIPAARLAPPAAYLAALALAQVGPHPLAPAQRVAHPANCTCARVLARGSAHARRRDRASTDASASAHAVWADVRDGHQCGAPRRGAPARRSALPRPVAHLCTPHSRRLLQHRNAASPRSTTCQPTALLL